MSTLGKTGLSRLFVFNRGIYKRNAVAEYISCAAMDALTQSRGDPTRIECPSDSQYDTFDVIDQIEGELSNLTTTINSYMFTDEVSRWRKSFDNVCPIDIHLHFGACDRPSNFNQYDKAYIFTDVRVTSWGTDGPVGALQSADRAQITETVDISASNFYEILAKLNYSARNATVLDANSPLVDITLCDNPNCVAGGCGDSDGCQVIHALGSDCVVYTSTDGGDTWIDQTIPVADCIGTPVAGTCAGDNYIVVQSEGTVAWTPLLSLINDDDTQWQHLTTAITGVPSAILSTDDGYFLVGTEAGTIYRGYSDPSQSLVVVEDGTNSGGNGINGFGMSPDGRVVAVGDADTVLYSDNMTTWVAVPNAPTTGGNLLSVAAKSDENWVIGHATGVITTDDSGCTYGDACSCGGPVTDIGMSNPHVLWLVCNGSIYRSIDGGVSCVLEPNSDNNCRAVTVNLGTVEKVAACPYDPNFIIGAGTNVAATGGLILKGAP